MYSAGGTRKVSSSSSSSRLVVVVVVLSILKGLGPIVQNNFTCYIHVCIYKMSFIICRYGLVYVRNESLMHLSMYVYINMINA